MTATVRKRQVMDIVLDLGDTHGDIVWSATVSLDEARNIVDRLRAAADKIEEFLGGPLR